MNEFIVKILQHWGVNPDSMYWIYWFLVAIVLILIIYSVNIFCFRGIIPMIRKFTKGTRSKWDDILLNDNLLRDVVYLFPPLIIALLLPVAFSSENAVLEFILKVNTIYSIVMVSKMLCSFLSTLYNLSSHNDRFRNHPLKGIYQMLKIAVVCVALIIIVSILINKNPGYVLTALGASAAVLMLIFKDMIMGLVAGVQLSANDMLRPGDWISMPKHGADGDVIEVTILDDVLATGGTAEGLAKSLEAQKIVVNGKEYGVKVKEFVFIVEITDLKGKERLEKIAPVKSIVHL